VGYFQGKRVFLVGGSEGIGRATAIEFARSGAHVIIAARRQGPLDEAVEAMTKVAGAEQVCASISLDVMDREAVRSAVDTVLGELGGLDVLVTNVGYARVGYLHELDDGDFDRLIGVNYLGHANVIRAFMPHFMAQRSGDICMVSSVLGFFSTAGYGAYSASKYAVRGFAEALRQELLTYNVRVSMFYPGTTETPGLEKENEGKPAAVWKLESESMFNSIHQPEHVASGILNSIRRGRFDNVIGFENKLMWTLFHIAPRLSRWIADMDWKKAVKKVAETQSSGSDAQETA